MALPDKKQLDGGCSSCSSSGSDSLIRVADDVCITPVSDVDMQSDDTRDQNIMDAEHFLSAHDACDMYSTPSSSNSTQSIDMNASFNPTPSSPLHLQAQSKHQASPIPATRTFASDLLQMRNLSNLTIQNIDFVTFNIHDMELLGSLTGLTRLHWTDNSSLPDNGISSALAPLSSLRQLHLDTAISKVHEVLRHCSGSLSRLSSLTLLAGDTHHHSISSRRIDWSHLVHLRYLERLVLRPAPQRHSIEVLLPNLQKFQIADPESIGVSEYLQELLLKEKASWLNNGSLMGIQREVTLGMRAVVVDWMVEIGDDWRLSWDAVHLGIHILDAFLASRRVVRRSLQLLAVACLWIGAKFHDLHPPSARDCATAADSRCHWREVVQMEQTVLEAVGFDFAVPTTATFMQAYSAGIAQDDLVPVFARYFCDLAVLHYSTSRFQPSYLAAAALWLAVGLGRMHNPEVCVVPGLQLGPKELGASIAELVSAYKWASYGNGRSSYVRQKYSQRKLHRVAKLPHDLAQMNA